jgi:DNA repair exonuclease SbcCD ATPase subunit
MAQMKLALLLAFIAPAASLRSASHKSQATPVEKVAQLLEKLSAQVAEEGKKEAAQYDKYACFCKEQADQKIYQIEKSEAKIETLTAEIEQLEAQIADLSADIATLGE